LAKKVFTANDIAVTLSPLFAKPPLDLLCCPLPIFDRETVLDSEIY